MVFLTVTPALLCRISILPYLATMASTVFFTCSSLVTSHWKKAASRPASRSSFAFSSPLGLKEREEQIAEGETPLAEAPGETPTAPEEETIEENAAAKAGIRTGLMIGGTVAALGMAAVLAVLIVTQRKRNRAERR